MNKYYLEWIHTKSNLHILPGPNNWCLTFEYMVRIEAQSTLSVRKVSQVLITNLDPYILQTKNNYKFLLLGLIPIDCESIYAIKLGPGVLLLKSKHFFSFDTTHDRSGVYIPGKQTRLWDVLSAGQVQVSQGAVYSDQFHEELEGGRNWLQNKIEVSD